MSAEGLRECGEKMNFSSNQRADWEAHQGGREERRGASSAGEDESPLIPGPHPGPSLWVSGQSTSTQSG